MKRLFLVLAVPLTLAAVPQSAEAEGFSLGIGGVYGEEIEEFGVQVNGYVGEAFGHEWLRLGGDFTFYDTPSGVDFWELNGNGHFLFSDTVDARAYAIGGINYSRMRVTFSGPGFGRTRASDSEIGLNLGLGGELKLGFGDVYGEVKYVISDFDQLSVGAGVRFPIGR